MANDKRPSFTKGMTPRGIFVFPKLSAPDTKFKADGEFGVKLRLGADESEKLIAKIEGELKAYWPKAKAELEEKVAAAPAGEKRAKAKKALADMKEADKSYKPVYNDEEEETGEYEFNFKMPAVYTKDKGKATERKVSMRPDVFDAKGKKLEKVPEIWGGTEGIVSYELRPFNTAVGVGISLRLKAVQVIKLVAGGGARDAASYGFGAHEDGFEASDEAQMADHSGDEGATPSTSDGEDDENF
jgi:hypothetical protein